MLLPLLILAQPALAQPSHPSFERALAASVVITADNVELNGAGTFDFTPDPAAFPEGIERGASPLMIRLWLDATGKLIECETGEKRTGPLAEIACAQLMKSATFRLHPGFALPLRRGFIDVSFSVFKDQSAGDGERRIFATPRPAYANAPITYPVDETPAADRLTQADGSFAIAITSDDYPSMALRHGLESESAMLLGIGRDGAVRSCRPLPAQGLRSAMLDNYTCRLFTDRGRFNFAADAARYEGLHYLTRKMRWQLPK